MRLQLERVRAMPARLAPGVLYVSEEFETAAHLCACGCGRKVRTPLGPTEWEFTADEEGPSLWPSIGNWQFPCRSHYIVDNGSIEWSYSWKPFEIADGREREAARREAYFRRNRVRRWFERLGSWLQLMLTNWRGR